MNDPFNPWKNTREWLDKKYPKDKRDKIKKIVVDHDVLEGDLDLSDFPNLEVFQFKKVPYPFDHTRHQGLADIYSIDVSKNPNLKVLDIYKTKITKIDLRNKPNLVDLSIGGNSLLTEIDLSELKNLEKLSVKGNKKIKKLDLQNCKKLNKLYVRANYIEELDLSETQIKKEDYNYCCPRFYESNRGADICKYYPKWKMVVDLPLNKINFDKKYKNQSNKREVSELPRQQSKSTIYLVIYYVAAILWLLLIMLVKKNKQKKYKNHD